MECLGRSKAEHRRQVSTRMVAEHNPSAQSAGKDNEPKNLKPVYTNVYSVRDLGNLRARNTFRGLGQKMLVQASLFCFSGPADL